MRLMGFTTIVGLALLGGCAGTAGPEQPVLDHPANPDATQSPAPRGSGTLSIRSPDETTRAATTTRPGETGMGGAAIVAGLYQCPMHPEVRSNNPNDRCPKCNMKINKPVKAATMPAGGHEGH